jgi:hypothetical protein
MISRDILNDARSTPQLSEEDEATSTPDSSHKKGHIPLLLKLSTLLLGVAIARGATPPDNQGNQSKKNLLTNKIATSVFPSTATPDQFRVTELPPEMHFDTALYGTATALDLKDKQSSFVEEGGFTEEMFESVRKGTFLIQVTGELTSGPEKGQVKTADGTGWLAKKSDGSIYLVANRHLLKFENMNIRSVSVWRPGIDKAAFTYPWTRCEISTSEEFDVGVLKCPDLSNLAKATESEPTALDFIDNAQLENGQPLLMVGFPHNFFISKNDTFDSRTLGSVIVKEKDYYFDKQRAWWARGLSSGGGSGSPIANNQLKIVGMMYASGESEVKVNDTNQQVQNVLAFTPLDVNGLIASLDKK